MSSKYEYIKPRHRDYFTLKEPAFGFNKGANFLMRHKDEELDFYMYMPSDGVYNEECGFTLPWGEQLTHDYFDIY